MHIQNLVKFYNFVLKILCGNEILNRILASIGGHNSITNAGKMMCNNLNLDRININAYTNLVKFYQFVLKISSGYKIMTDGQNDGQPKSSSHLFLKRCYNDYTQNTFIL